MTKNSLQPHPLRAPEEVDQFMLKNFEKNLTGTVLQKRTVPILSRKTVPGRTMRKFFWILAFLFLILCPMNAALANGLTISNVKVVGWDTEADTAEIQFDITWNNAWRDATNWDAAWVFIKFNFDDTIWQHASLAHQGHTISVGKEIVLPSDYKGAFIQFSYTQSSNPSTFTATGVKLVWEYGKDSLSDAEVKSSLTNVRVYGIEMVYIPAGAFYAGDGTATATPPSDYGFTQGTPTDYDPWYISSEALIHCTNASTNGFYYQNAGNTGEDSSGSDFWIPAGFPKGYQAFYLMKYEISQGQYRDFLNTLTQAEQNSRTESDLSNENDANTYVMVTEGQATVSYRQTIKAGSNPSDGEPYTFFCDLSDDDDGNDADDGQWIAMNYISWMDLCAYADWAALRPMTELEFEKAARGTTLHLNHEYPWGSTTLESYTTSLTNAGEAGEVPNQGNLNYNSCAPDGPYRVGSYADGSSTKQNAGGGYYGNLELSGNLGDLVVTVGNSTGRLFSGTHGDGVLSSASGYEGNATNTDWPGIDTTVARGVTDDVGRGYRGGSFANLNDYGRTSDRSTGASHYWFRNQSNYIGGRCARTAPE